MFKHQRKGYYLRSQYSLDRALYVLIVSTKHDATKDSIIIKPNFRMFIKYPVKLLSNNKWYSKTHIKILNVILLTSFHITFDIQTFSQMEKNE